MCFGFVSLEWGLRVASELLHQARQGCLERGAAEVSLGLQMGVEDKQLALSLLGLVPSTVAWGDGTPFLLFEPLQHRSWVGQGFTGADPASPWRPVRCGGEHERRAFHLLAELAPHARPLVSERGVAHA